MDNIVAFGYFGDWLGNHCMYQEYVHVHVHVHVLALACACIVMFIILLNNNYSLSLTPSPSSLFPLPPSVRPSSPHLSCFHLPPSPPLLPLPSPEEWSMEDKVIFEQAFQFHGKNFQRIRAMLPDKPISSLVKYYYLWKRSYAQFSLMDKQSRRNGKRLK